MKIELPTSRKSLALKDIPLGDIFVRLQGCGTVWMRTVEFREGEIRVLRMSDGCYDWFAKEAEVVHHPNAKCVVGDHD